MRKPAIIGLAIVCLLAVTVFLLLVWTDHKGSAGKEIPGIGTPDYIYTGEDDTLYLFSDHNITAVAPDGMLKYRFSLPAGYIVPGRWYIDEWLGNVYPQSTRQPVAFSDNGTLYVYLVSGETVARTSSSTESMANYFCNGTLLSISPQGMEQWSLSVPSMVLPLTKPWTNSLTEDWNLTCSDLYISQGGGRLYVFHGYNETAIDTNGTPLWTIGDVTDPAAVDDNGNVYLTHPPRTPVTSESGMLTIYGGDGLYTKVDYRVPGTIIDSYDRNGTLRSRTLAIDPVQRQFLPGPQLQYKNGTVYAFLEDTVIAIDKEGNQLWKKRFERNDYPFLPEDQWTYIEKYGKYFDIPEGGAFRFDRDIGFDHEGNLYLKYTTKDQYSGSYYTIVLAPNGSEISSRKVSIRSDDGDYVAKDGVLYRKETSSASGLTSYQNTLAESKTNYTLTAYDARAGTMLWNFTVPASTPEEGELTEANIKRLFDENTADRLINYSKTKNLTSLIGPIVRDNETTLYNWDQSSLIAARGGMDIKPGNGRVYVDVRSFYFENPIFYANPRYTYSGGVYALDSNGTLLWSIPVALNDKVLTTGNSTIFYETGDGKIYVKYAGAAAGVTFLSALFLFFKYFLAGTVARARSRLDQNDNRKAVLQFVRENPGFTMYEIARGTGQNLGTVRYHLLILSINHKILEHRAGGKYVRYFTNGGSYTQQERTVISLLKRDTTGRVLGLLHSKPGASNGEISRELDIPESTASRCTKELTDLGLITKEPSGRGFRLKEEYGRLVDRIAGKL